MFENLGWPEIFGLLLVALFILGPERLPKVVSEVLRGLRKLRRMASNATADLSRELGTDVRVEDLHPKAFLRKHVLSEEDEEALRRPLTQFYSDAEDLVKDNDPEEILGSDPPVTKSNGHKKAKFDADAT